MCDRYSVPSLEDTCVRWISKNLHSVITKCSDCVEPKYVWRFPWPDCRIIARPAEKILLKLCKRQILRDEYLNLFSSKYVDLISPVLRDVPVTSSALRILRDFKLYNLTATNLKQVNLNGLIGCLGEASAENLVSLNVSNANIEENKLPVIVSLGRLKNLQVLNVSRTRFTSECLQNTVKLLPRLRYLNISRTNINNITALLDLRETLTGLIMHRLTLDSKSHEKVLLTVLELKALRVLDVSSAPDQDKPRLPAVDRLCAPGALPHLTHFDICGNQFSLRLSDVKSFIENHPKLEFIGLAAWPTRQNYEFEGIYQLSLKYPHITILGDRGEKPLLASLTRNKDRRLYLQNAFHNIFEETSSREWLNPDLLAAVLRVMRLHMNRPEMILAGTAVVYNLTRGEQSAQLPLELLNRAVSITLMSIEHHQTQVQLLKNCFLTLCSDNVLHRAQFSCKRCFELVFRSLINFNDVHMKRMGVAIISILAAEIPTADLRELSSDRKRLQQLLMYVVEKCLLRSDVDALLAEPHNQMLNYLKYAQVPETGSPVYDTTLRFTLSALWNLTDECPEACQAFVHVGGLLIYAKVLKKVADEEEDFKNHVYTKCLGLLNNVAEVRCTKNTLLMEPLMDFFNKMLSHPSIQISYFAAGIVSHLACLSDDTWFSALQFNKSDYIRVLGEAVCKWSPPQNEMVAYRSFQPFQSLILDPNSRLEMHLWAVWAIHHILTKKNSRYVPVLRECPYLQRFLLYVVSVDAATLCLPHYHLDNFLQNRNLSVSSSLAIPESWRSLGSTPIWATHLDLSNHNNAASEAPSTSAPFLVPSDSLARLPAFDLSSDKPVTHQQAASIGPTDAQLTCAALLQRLASEIIDAVRQFETESAR
uniref:Protein zyg-11 homolog B n=1 Tax=Mesocestoides corti TaxID=53468 RepID=A0A5K3FR18_MESCO